MPKSFSIRSNQQNSFGENASSISPLQNYFTVNLTNRVASSNLQIPLQTCQEDFTPRVSLLPGLTELPAYNLAVTMITP